MGKKTFLLISFLFSAPAAACVVPADDLEALSQAQLAFRVKPSRETAEKFVASLPLDFCRFLVVYGYGEVTKEGPLYNSNFFDLLPRLVQHVSVERLISVYLRYAVDAHWDADNVNALQDAYLKAVRQSPDAFVRDLRGFPEQKRINALEFLFDGPHPDHPRNIEYFNYLTEAICTRDEMICTEIKLAWRNVLARSDH